MFTPRIPITNVQIIRTHGYTHDVCVCVCACCSQWRLYLISIFSFAACYLYGGASDGIDSMGSVGVGTRVILWNPSLQ